MTDKTKPNDSQFTPTSETVIPIPPMPVPPPREPFVNDSSLEATDVSRRLDRVSAMIAGIQTQISNLGQSVAEDRIKKVNETRDLDRYVKELSKGMDQITMASERPVKAEMSEYLQNRLEEVVKLTKERTEQHDSQRQTFNNVVNDLHATMSATFDRVLSNVETLRTQNNQNLEGTFETQFNLMIGMQSTVNALNARLDELELKRATDREQFADQLDRIEQLLKGII